MDKKFACIVVIGTSGCGKTTLARALAKKLDIPHIELDELCWQPEWTPRPADEFKQVVLQATKEGPWVADGNYSAVRDLVWARAGTLIWLNYSFLTVFSRAIIRTFKRVVYKEALFSGNVETFKDVLFSSDSIPIWVLKTFWKRKKSLPILLKNEQFAHLDVVELKNQKMADNWLESIFVETA